MVSYIALKKDNEVIFLEKNADIYSVKNCNAELVTNYAEICHKNAFSTALFNLKNKGYIQFNNPSKNDYRAFKKARKIYNRQKILLREFCEYMD